MSNIEIEGYETIEANKFFQKEEGVEIELPERTAYIRDVLGLSRYTMPSREQVVDFIISEAKNVKDGKPSSIASAIPPDEIEKIASRNKRIINLIRGIHDKTNVFSGLTFLELIYLRMEESFIPDFLEFPEDKKSEILDEYATEMSLIQLVDGSLPQRETLECLLGAKVTSSELVAIKSNRKYEEAANLVRLVYNSLSSQRELIKRIRDYSKEFIEEEAKIILSHLNMHLLQGKARTLIEQIENLPPLYLSLIHPPKTRGINN